VEVTNVAGSVAANTPEKVVVIGRHEPVTAESWDQTASNIPGNKG